MLKQQQQKQNQQQQLMSMLFASYPYLYISNQKGNYIMWK